jgi:hypothetical protein
MSPNNNWVVKRASGQGAQERDAKKRERFFAPILPSGHQTAVSIPCKGGVNFRTKARSESTFTLR